MKIKGVNLGNWLVLEKWMSPALFYGTDAMDEYDLPRALSKEVDADGNETLISAGEGVVAVRIPGGRTCLTASFPESPWSDRAFHRRCGSQAGRSLTMWFHTIRLPGCFMICSVKFA